MDQKCRHDLDGFSAQGLMFSTRDWPLLGSQRFICGRTCFQLLSSCWQNQLPSVRGIHAACFFKANEGERLREAKEGGEEGARETDQERKTKRLSLEEKFYGIIPFQKDTAVCWPEERKIINHKRYPQNVSITYQLCSIFDAYPMK